MSSFTQTDAKLKEGDAPNDFRTPGNNVKCGLEPNKNKRLERSTSQLPNTEAIYSSHHDIPQQAKLRRSEDYSELPHSSKEDHSMHNELVKLTVTKFLGEMLDKAMSSFDISSRRSLEDCAEDESDSDNDELDDYDSDTEQFPASGTRNIGSFSNTDGYSIQSTSSNTSCGFSSRPSASESGSSSQTTSSGGENKGKGHPVVSPEYRNKRRRKILPSKGRSDQDDGRGSDDENEPVEKRKLSEFYINGKNLACPFYQRRPQLHPKSTACIHPGFKTIARLKYVYPYLSSYLSFCMLRICQGAPLSAALPNIMPTLRAEFRARGRAEDSLESEGCLREYRRGTERGIHDNSAEGSTSK